MSKIIRSYYNIKSHQQGGIITIGHFDGMHLGHQKVFQLLLQKAKELSVPSIVVTFEPYAFEFFQAKNNSIARLSSLREKCEAILQKGVDYILVLPFNQKLAGLSAEQFITNILAQYIQPKAIVVGEDFHFGYKRQGNISLLTERGKQWGFTVTAMETVTLLEEKVSSTRIRKALADGDHNLANTLLGHPYSMLGKVQRGQGLGKQWGCPTINIRPHRRLAAVHGIYTVRVFGLAEQALPGVASIGTRPTIDGSETVLEVHLLNFDQDVYGKYVKVEFCQKLREEIRYDSIALLKEQIAQDVKDAREFFKKNTY